MPGRGNHGGESPEPSHALGDKLKDEVRSALKLLFKNVEQRAFDTGISTEFTTYLTELSGECTAVPVEQAIPAVSDNPIAALQTNAAKPNTLPVAMEGRLANDSPCQIVPSLCKETLLNHESPTTAGVSFENVEWADSSTVPVEPLQTQVKARPIKLAEQAQPRSITPTGLKTQQAQPPVTFTTPTTHESHRVFGLPIKKTAIPPHRFPAEIRELFRQALADKAGIPVATIQLRVIFERLNMALYTSIQQDEQGGLLCVPKNEFLGRNRNKPSNKAVLDQLATGSGSSYLVVGTRLDTRQDIRALVPVETIPR